MRKFSNRVRLLSLSSLLVLFASAVVVAQVPAAPRPSPTPPPNPVDGTIKGQDSNPPMTSMEEEMRAKRAIKMAEKDRQENLKRAHEVAEIGKDLKEALKDKSTLDRDSLKKVERLEKLTKKIRSEAGGEDEDITIPNPPSDLASAVTQIADASETLCKSVQDTPRQVVSASVIGNANVLLELIKVARSFAGKL